MIRRIAAAMGANSFGMATAIGIQLASLPLFLLHWDTATYGTWLMLSSLPAYLAMADVGMVTAAGNKMTMAIGRGDTTEANRVFQSAQVFMAMVCLPLAAVVLPVVLWAPLPGLTTTDQRLALTALAAGVLVSLFGGLAEAVFRSTERYATGTMIGTLVRLFEWLGSMAALALVGSFSAVALGGLVCRVTGTLAAILLSRRHSRGLHWGVAAARSAEIRAMAAPALSFMAFPLANAMSFQGMTLLVGALFGPVAVALFNTYRTIARVAVQVTGLFSHALWPEFSRLFGQGTAAPLRNLFRRAALLGAAQSVLLSVVLYFLSPWLLQVWSRGTIAFVPSVMALMLLYAAVAGLLHIPRVMLMATNQHVALAQWSVAAAALSVALGWTMGVRLQVEGVAGAMLITELLIALACFALAHGALGGLRQRASVAA